MTELITPQSINELKKSRNNIIVYIIISLVIASGLIVLLFFFANRSNRYFFNVLISIVASLGASFILYLCVVSLVPLNHYLKLCDSSLSGNKYMTKGQIISSTDKVTHYKGVAVKEIRVKDLEEENKEYVFYVEQNVEIKLEENKTYSLITYQNVVVAYEEVI